MAEVIPDKNYKIVIYCPICNGQREALITKSYNALKCKGCGVVHIKDGVKYQII